jgi:hypothetical protein
MRRNVLLFALAVSCGGDPIESAEDCKKAGGRFVPADGPAARCESSEEKIADIPFGIEGAICCRTRLSTWN